MSHKINDGLTKSRRWALRHPERVRAKSRRQYWKHPERHRAYALAYYRKVRDTEKHRMAKRKTSYEHYLRHRARCNEQSRLRSAERLKFLQELKANTPCMDCGVNYPHYVMEFDHRDPTTKEVPFCSLLSRTWERIFTELDKCDIVCANCHNTRTWDRRQKLSSLTPGSVANTMPNSSPEVSSVGSIQQMPLSNQEMVN